MIPFPDVVTHNYDPDRGAFRNVCELPEAEAETILDQIRATGQRRIESNYLQRRLAVEGWLISESRKKLGTTSLERPIYFFLGDFADGADPSRAMSHVVPLSVFSPSMLTFTYPDSMASFSIATRDDSPCHRKPYHGQVFTLPEIKDVVARFGMPGDRWKTDPSMRYDTFIEVQLWNDEPIRQLLKSC